ncbi:glycosyltransferase family 4 protein [Patescibacteria group bacterium]|jgi:glycosyltransferase involved in cell wall biosynthesis|nr:glycosyltransferase family 4 protein [Patescibacteria group bacterium]
MKVLMDGRPLLRPWMGGVPRLTSLLVPAIQQALTPDELVTVVTGLGTQRPIPNKIVAFLTWTGLFSFDRLFHEQKADALFLPNLEFVGRPQLPYALLVHDLSFLIEPRWFGWKSRLWHLLVKPRQLIQNAAHLFTVSNTSKQDLMRLLDIPAERITVIPLGLDETPPSNDTSYVLRDTRYILCLGAANHRKNTECVIAAHAELITQEKYKDVKLVITGTPEYPRPSYEELFALMRDAAVFCYPSWYEGFGMPLHEAARFGTPCIASTASSLPEIAPQGTRFASPAKPQHWLEAICQALDNRETHQTQTMLCDWNPAGSLIAQRLKDIAKT